MTKEDLKRTVAFSLSKFGFKRKGWSWYFSNEDNVVAIDLQKSNYSLKYYINICNAPLSMNVDGMPTPKEHKFPIRIRADGVFPSLEGEIDKIFDLENDMFPDEQRSERISDLLENDIAPFALRIGDISGLKSAIAEGIFERGLISIAAKEHLGL